MKLKLTLALILGLVILVLNSAIPAHAYGYLTTVEVDQGLALEGIGQQNFSKVTYQKTVELVGHFIEDTEGYLMTPNGYGWSSQGSDSRYTTDLLTGKEGCYHYADFVSKTIYGSREAEEIIRFRQDGEGYSVDSLRAYFEKEAQAGEHIRVEDIHSLVFLSTDQQGIYTLQYYGVWEPPFLSYMTYEELLDILNISGAELILYNYDTSKNISLNKVSLFTEEISRSYSKKKAGAIPERFINNSSSFY